MNYAANSRAVLIIGVHRDELAFGDKVVAGLEPSLIDILRIPEGLTGRHPRQDQMFHYEIRHRELYYQLLGQIRGRYSMAIDLHCGLNEDGSCADLIATDRLLLAGVQRHAIAQFGKSEGNRILRPVLLGSGSDAHSPEYPIRAHTIIPAEFCNAPTFAYAGIEIYLTSRGSGTASEWELTRWLIRTVIKCHTFNDNDGPPTKFRPHYKS